MFGNRPSIWGWFADDDDLPEEWRIKLSSLLKHFRCSRVWWSSSRAWTRETANGCSSKRECRERPKLCTVHLQTNSECRCQVVVPDHVSESWLYFLFDCLHRCYFVVVHHPDLRPYYFCRIHRRCCHRRGRLRYDHFPLPGVFRHVRGSHHALCRHQNFVMRPIQHHRFVSQCL